MVKALITDFSRVLLFPKDKNYKGSLNALHKELSNQQGYNILDYFEVNTELLDYYKSIRDKVALYIFTSETIQDSPELQPFIQHVFSAVYSALKMGVSKKDEDTYRKLSSLIGFPADEIVYIDDSGVNVNAAKKVSLQTILYKDNKSLKEEIQRRLTK
jgi:HAD superfamily hydrolase (TIGR01509 family)